MTLRQIWEQWDKFWFTPQPPVVLGLVRILYGLLVLEACFSWLRTF